MATHPLDDVRLIGLSGHIGSGKTTLARYLTERYPDVERHAFAENLRVVLAVLTGVPVKRTRSADDKERVPEGWGATVGQLLQRVGSAVRQGVNWDAWVLSLFAQFDPTRHRWVVEDVRHVNEAEAVRQRGGVLIRLEGDPAGLRAQSTRDLNHESETALDDYAHFDVIVDSGLFCDCLDDMYDEIGRQLLLKRERTTV